MSDTPWLTQLKAYPIDWLLLEPVPDVCLGALVHHVVRRSHDLSKALNARLTKLPFPSIYSPDFVKVLRRHLSFPPTHTTDLPQ